MAFVIADRVRETSTTTGTGNFTLAGAVDRFRTFDSVLDTGDTTYYTIADQSGVGWEVGIATFTSPSTLARTTILSSSNGGSAVDFGAGSKDVFITLPASRTVISFSGGSTGLTPSTASYGAISLGGTLVVGNGGTGTAATFTAGSVVFAGASGVYSQDNSNLFWDDTNNRLGVGTTSPDASLTVNTIASFGAGTAGAPSVAAKGDLDTGIYFSAANTLDVSTGGTQRAQFDSSGNLKFNSGYGSVATAYGCRAWVNFNGTGTVAINASGNVSSITDLATGVFKVNFTNNMPDANYAISGSCQNGTSDRNIIVASTSTADSASVTAIAVGSFCFKTMSTANVTFDQASTMVAVFR